MQEKETILEKVKKLLAKANAQGVSEEEAQIFTNKANELLIKYNLSITQVSDIGGKTRVTQDFITLGDYAGKTDGDWVQLLLNALAKANFCDYLTLVDFNKKQGTLIGRKENLEVLKYMFEYLYGTIKSLESKTWKSYLGNEKRNAFKRGFYRGCVIRIATRLRENMEKVVQEEAQVNNQTNALILVRNTEVKEFKETAYPDASQRKTTKLSGLNGRQLGDIAGRNISLNKQLNQNFNHEQLQ